MTPPPNNFHVQAPQTQERSFNVEVSRDVFRHFIQSIVNPVARAGRFGPGVVAVALQMAQRIANVLKTFSSQETNERPITIQFWQGPINAPKAINAQGGLYGETNH